MHLIYISRMLTTQKRLIDYVSSKIAILHTNFQEPQITKAATTHSAVNQ